MIPATFPSATTTTNSKSDGGGIPVSRVARSLAITLCIGFGINVVTGYEWLPFRVTDLYSWAPASSVTYRPLVGTARFVLPREYGIEDANGISVENLPGVQIFDRMVGKRLVMKMATDQFQQQMEDTKDLQLLMALRQKLRSYREENKNSTMNVPLVVRRLEIVVDVIDEPLDLLSRLTLTNYPRLERLAFEEGGIQERYGDSLHRMKYERAYPFSPVFWLLLSVPIIFLVRDVALPKVLGESFQVPARRALFTPFAKPTQLLKDWFVDPMAIIGCVQEAKGLNNMRGTLDLVDLKITHVLTLAASDLVAAYVVRRFSSSRTKPWFVDVALVYKMAVRIFAIVSCTYCTYLYEMRYDMRFLSMTRFILGQILGASLFTDIVWRLSDKNEPQAANRQKQSPDSLLDRTTIEAGTMKLVLSTMMFYGAAATKLGEAGLGWIDDRYLAQLALRGNYKEGDGPYPLAALLVYAPPAFRAGGMIVILCMELFALLSWWHFGFNLAIWCSFMVGSTLSIGVPMTPETLGPLNPLFHAIAVTVMDAIVQGTVAGLSIFMLGTFAVISVLFWVQKRTKKKNL